MNNSFFPGVIVGLFGLLICWIIFLASHGPNTNVPLNTIDVGNKICENHNGLSNIQVDRESYFIRCEASERYIIVNIDDVEYFMDKK